MTKKKTAKKKVAKKVTVKTEEKLTSGDHAKKVVEANEFKRAVVEGKDAVILINIFSPNNTPQEFKVRVPNVTGNCPPPHREPAYIAGVLVGALKRKYGNKVK